MRQERFRAANARLLETIFLTSQGFFKCDGSVKSQNCHAWTWTIQTHLLLHHKHSHSFANENTTRTNGRLSSSQKLTPPFSFKRASQAQFKRGCSKLQHLPTIPKACLQLFANLSTTGLVSPPLEAGQVVIPNIAVVNCC